MLKNILVNAGRYTPIATAGNHINIVLAAGEIEIRAELENGSVYATPAVQGMALELPRFKSVHVGGKVSQQTKIWVGDIPLSYSPDSARQVGSNGLQSSIGYVYSGYPHELLPAEIGRNRITLTPQQDIYLGGSNLSTKNGVLLPAGQTFTMATQGAVYALEITGNFQPYFTALVPASEILNSIGETAIGETQPLVIYHENRDRTRGWGFRSTQNQTNRLYEYDPATREATGFYMNFGSNNWYTNSYRQRGDILVNWNNGYFRMCDLNAGTWAIHTPAALGAGDDIRHYCFNGQYEYLAADSGKIYRHIIGEDESAWELYADAPPITLGNTSSLRGFEVLSTGRIVWVNTSQLWYKDEGSAWVQGAYYGASVFGAGSVDQVQIDHSADAIYAINKSEVAVTFDGGESWQVEYSYSDNNDFNGREASGMEVLNGALLMWSYEGYGYRNPQTGEWTVKDLPFGQRNAARCCLNPSGAAYFAINANNVSFETSIFLDGRGTPEPVGGLPVAIMAEVN